LATGYGRKQVVNGVSLSVDSSEVVALIGHNGAGKSTLLKALFGLLPIWAGQIVLDGEVLKTVNPRRLLRSGIAYVPQGNRVFNDLTVRENLKLGAVTLPNESVASEGVARALRLFPALKSRYHQHAGTLSGGEKQMLALGNALVLFPRLLLLDEPSLGLAPPLISQALNRIKELSLDSGTAVLIVEQKVREVLKIANRVYVLRNGRVSFSGPAENLFDDAKLREVYL
jgi:branched-chain amino acid transport system ATP-binding protein